MMVADVLQELSELLAATDPDQAYGLEVSVVDVARYSCSAAAELLSRPLAALELFDMALIEAQAQMLQLLPNQCVWLEPIDLRMHVLLQFDKSACVASRNLEKAEDEPSAVLQGEHECEGASARAHCGTAMDGGQCGPPAGT